MKILVVEDDTNRHRFFLQELIGHDVTIAEDYYEAIECLTHNIYDLIYLDHDLEDEHYFDLNVMKERTGCEVARWMVNHSRNNLTAKIIIHSLNSVGAENIFNVLNDAKYNVKKVNYLMLKRMAGR